MFEDKWMHKVNIARHHPKHNDVDWVFGFSSIFVHLFGTVQAKSRSVCSPSDPGRSFSHPRKKKTQYDRLEGMLEFVEKFFVLHRLCQRFSFFLLYQTYYISTC